MSPGLGRVMNMRRHEPSAVIVRSTIDLAHSLGLRVVAEGVEDRTTFSTLADLGCDRIQGYLVAKAMPGDALDDWSRTQRPSSWTTVRPLPIRQREAELALSLPETRSA